MSTSVTTVYRDQLTELLGWYRHTLPRFSWGVVIHRRRERGRERFGIVTLGGESMVLTEPLLQSLAATGCWLDGAVQVHLRDMSSAPDPLALDFARPGRAPLVDRLGLTVDGGFTDESDEGELIFDFTGEFIPASLPGELFLLTRRVPPGWPR